MALCERWLAEACIKRLLVMILSVFQMVLGPEWAQKADRFACRIAIFPAVIVSSFGRARAWEMARPAWRQRRWAAGMTPWLHGHDKAVRPNNKSERTPRSSWQYLPKVCVAECSSAAGLESQNSP